MSLPQLKALEIGGRRWRSVDLPASAGPELQRLPWLMRLLLENVLPHGDGSDRDAATAAIFARTRYPRPLFANATD